MARDQRFGYDKTPSMFSPDGRVLQLEYARVAMRRGHLTLAIVADKAVILGGLIPRSRLLHPLEKIFQIDDHIAGAYAGYAADGRVVINMARQIAYENRILYGEEIDVYTLAERLGEFMQQYTQFGGVRPFGVGIFLGGYDVNGPRTYFVDPGGTIFGVKAYCVGKGDDDVLELLKKKYSESLSVDEAVRLATEAMVRAMKSEKSSESKGEYEPGVSHERILLVTIDESGLKRVPSERIREIIEQLGGDSE